MFHIKRRLRNFFRATARCFSHILSYLVVYRDAQTYVVICPYQFKLLAYFYKRRLSYDLGEISMPKLVWWIIAGGFGAPLLVLLGLVIANRLGKGNTGKTINILWAILAALLIVFLGFGIFGGAK